MLLLTSIILTLINGVWLGFMFYWAGTCVINLFIVISTTISVILFYVFSLLRLCNVSIFRRNATIFTISLASIYIVYLSWSAMATNEECLPYDETINTGL
jgi:hypothetical protein